MPLNAIVADHLVRDRVAADHARAKREDLPAASGVRSAETTGQACQHQAHVLRPHQYLVGLVHAQAGRFIGVQAVERRAVGHVLARLQR